LRLVVAMELSDRSRTQSGAKRSRFRRHDMGIKVFSRFVISSCVAAAILAGCGGRQSGMSGTVPLTMRTTTQSHALKPSSSSDTLVYAFENLLGGQGDIYDLSSGKVTRLKQTFDAAGACSDKQGDITVCDL
jgi:hypothetical protein